MKFKRGLNICMGIALIYNSNSICQQTLTPTSSFLGTQDYERVGYHLHTAGDVNGDGYDDFLIGTFHNRVNGYNAGAAYLILGSQSANWGHDISLLNADAKFLGAKQYESAGYFLGGGGDVNGDGLDDFLIGAEDGYLYIVLGRANANWGMDFVLYDNADAWYEEENEEDAAGLSNAIIGDMNGDGYDDIICGAPYNDYGGDDAGKAYLILGKATSWQRGLNLNKADASFYGSYGSGLVGYCVDGVGDVNGDGIPDFAIGSRGQGKVFLFFGRKNVNWGKNYDINLADVIFVNEQYGNYTGWRVSGAGDVNKDGYDDFLIGAPYHDQNESEDGKVYLILGLSSGWKTSLSEADASYYGEAYDDEAGWDTQGAGDVNGDGYADFLIGAWYNDANGIDAGKMYLIKGKASGWQRNVPLSSIEDYFVGEHAGDYAGFSVAMAGDVNGDGLSDIITSASYYSQVYYWGGKIHIFVSNKTQISVVSPNGAENWKIGNTYNITWNSNHTSGYVKIEYSTNSGSSWKEIIASTMDDGSYFWTIPDGPSTNCLIKITDIDGDPTDQSDAVFIISQQASYISGSVVYDGTSRLVSNAIIDLTHSGGTRKDTTDANGGYLFENLSNGTVVIVLSKTEDWRDAIMGSDVLLVLQYLAFLKNMTEDQQFAADVTRDGKVTGSDAQAILRYLAFYSDNIGATGQWSFIPADTGFSLSAYAVADFKAYLKGDANLDWGKGTQLAKSDGDSRVALNITQANVTTSATVIVPIEVVTAGETINTLVFSLSYDPGHLKYLATEKSVLTEQFAIVSNGDEPGKIHIAMAGVKGIEHNGEILHLVFEVVDKEQSNDLEITHAFANDQKVTKFTRGHVNIDKQTGAVIPDHFNLNQNYPNPFNPETVISFQLPEASNVILKVYNLLGDEICSLVNEKKEAGSHQVIWSGKNNLGQEMPSGIYLVKIEAGDFRAYKKMVKIR